MAENDSSSLLVVTLNSNKVLEYNRGIALSKKQLKDLDVLEQKLNDHIPLNLRANRDAGPQDKATLVANMLITALLDEEESKAALTCAYLATRFSDLKQVNARTDSEHLAIQLIFDEEYREVSPIKFVARKDLN